MANYGMVHDRISKGRGRAARAVGQVFVQRRLTSTGWKVIKPDTRCILRQYKGRDLETRPFPSQWYELVTDVRRMDEGELLEENPDFRLAQPRTSRTVVDKATSVSNVGSVDQYWGPVYCLVHKRPVHKFIGLRLEMHCQVRRGNLTDGSFDLVDGDGGYQEQQHNNEQVLTLPSGTGVYVFQNVDDDPAPVPALIPFQLEVALVRGHPPHDLPMDWLQGKWHYATFSKWPGFTLQENDTLVTPEGKRHYIQTVWEGHIGPSVTQGLTQVAESG